MALQELKNHSVIGRKSTAHQRQLLKMTINQRPFIDEAKRVVDIIQEYPSLKNADLVCFLRKVY